MKIAIAPEALGYSRAVFRLLVDEKLVAERMTAAQTYILIGNIFEQLAPPSRQTESSVQRSARANARGPVTPIAKLSRRRTRPKAHREPPHQLAALRRLRRLPSLSPCHEFQGVDSITSEIAFMQTREVGFYGLGSGAYVLIAILLAVMGGPRTEISPGLPLDQTRTGPGLGAISQP